MKTICLLFLLIGCIPLKSMSVDTGIEIAKEPVFTVGVSYPAKDVTISTGVFAGDGFGPYLSLGYSWSPFR